MVSLPGLISFDCCCRMIQNIQVFSFSLKLSYSSPPLPPSPMRFLHPQHRHRVSRQICQLIRPHPQYSLHPHHHHHHHHHHRHLLQLRLLSATASLNVSTPVREAKAKGIKRLKPTPADAADTATATTFTTVTSEAAPARRRRKKSETFTLEQLELEQGLIINPHHHHLTGNDDSPALRPIVDAPKRYPTVVQQALDNMTRLPNCVLLTRVGGFYELYFSHAEQWASRLGLKLAVKRTVAGNVAMAGFPFWQLERFLKILVAEEGLYVAIAEECPHSSSFASSRTSGGAAAAAAGEPGLLPLKIIDNGLMWDRRVARIVTPGTLIDETWIEGGENNFLLAIDESDHEYGLSWADLGTGEVWCSTISGAIEELAAELARVGPREVVVTSANMEALVRNTVEPAFVITVHEVDPKHRKHAGKIKLWEDAAVSSKDFDRGSLEKLKPLEMNAAVRLLDYFESRLPGIQVKMQPPQSRKMAEVMAIDVNSMRGLEIKTTLKDGGSKGSLLHTINRTVTRGGKRRLSSWLSEFCILFISFFFFFFPGRLLTGAVLQPTLPRTSKSSMGD